jgi:hypothetical protein
MSGPIYTTVASGQGVSLAFTLERPDKPVVVFVPSLSAASEVRLTFSQTSGSGFTPLVERDGAAVFIHSVASGDGPFFGFLDRAPTPWGRVWLAGSQSDTRTFALYTRFP